MNENKKYLLVIEGPTASGKTALAIGLAQYFKAEILSCDSRQFFKEMTIGTAKPTTEELAAAVHHFVDCLSIEQAYNIGDFERDALSFLTTYYKEHDLAIMVGGSGLYSRAVCHGIDEYPAVDKGIREALNELLETKGIESLQEELAIADPIYYKKVDLSNPHRLIRALEICRGTGAPFSSFQGRNKVKRPFEVIKIGIDWDRAKLYERINLRVDLMLQNGLLEEAKSLYPKRHLNALQTVGYREFFDHFDGLTSLEEAIELVKRNTRRYAKRQLTWLRKETELHWVKAGTATDEVIDWVKNQLNKTNC
ncbi:tRNA (adenosine(37)-N6)-dimethylallyltransferase MiaA [Aureispira anguillae]|uniref:tRNA dimethylallyltransferase n=1 Tax=Aureispira anguillae TaxID=2864201 RepID=A0A915YI06_9BACT|nr:tRNA (adenosine(37)-N6)-dimethylallyltransferase MiaA [Aureispira anguillae]BDS13369.1 tRNA (adenosine(37)-N6)-dimethylallyltransferaseMiaA [Aureispira anguillae]